MQSAPFAILQPGTIFHGRYRVVRCIKAGGMGAVYEVVDQNTRTGRALKIMLPEVVHDADHRARFEQEAQITGGIDSDHIVRVIDAGIDSASTPFLVMELLRGEELADLVAKRKALSPGEVVFYLWQAALALDKTHAAGIVHRDLKPENLFVTSRDDGSPCVKILDFGIAKLVKGDQAQKTRALGTPLYMAPEQIRGASAEIGPRADLYTLGHIAYATLVGEAYWQEESKSSESLFPLLAKVISGATEAPSARARRRMGATLPPGFDAWFLKATAPRSGDRFERATTMITALAQATGVASPTPSMSLAQPLGDPAASGVAPRPAAEPTPAPLQAAPAAPAPAPLAALMSTMIYTAPQVAAPAPAVAPAPVAAAPVAALEVSPAVATAAPASSEGARTTGVVVGPAAAPAPRSALPFVLGAIAVLVSLGGVGFVVLRGNAAGPGATFVAVTPAPPAASAAVTVATPVSAVASGSATVAPAMSSAPAATSAAPVPFSGRLPVKPAVSVKAPEKAKPPKPDGIF